MNVYAIKAKQSLETYRTIASADESIADWRRDLILCDVALFQGKFAKALDGYEKSLNVSTKSVKDSIENKLNFIRN